eukprot:gene57703-biopygen97117
MIVWNVRGLMVKQGMKLAELQEVMQKEKAAWVILGETHINDTFEDDTVTALGYAPPFRLDRGEEDEVHVAKKGRKRRKHGGGLLVYVEEGREVEGPRKYRGDDFEMIAFDDVATRRRIIAVYRRPGSTVSKDLLDALDAEVQAEEWSPLVVGDLNMNTMCRYPQPRQLHTQLKVQHELRQQVKFVTRPPVGNRQRRWRKGTQLYPVWARTECPCTHIPELFVHSDHRAIRVQCGDWRKSPAQPVRRAWRRKWDAVDADEVKRILMEEMPERGMRARAQRPFIPQEAAEELAEQGITLPGVATSSTEEDGEEEARAVLDAWERAWERIKKELAPRVRTTVRKGDKQFPWVTDAVRDARRKRNELQRKAGTVEEKAAYRKARREAERMYKRARKTYIAEHWKKAGDTPFSKEHWRFLNSITGRKSKRKVEPRCSPDKVNDAFIQKVERIREPLLQVPKPEIERHPVDLPTLNNFRRVTTEEVMANLQQVKPTTSVGVDEVPMAMLTKHKGVLGEHIARVVNAVIETEWPKGWKSAEVMPLWKKRGSIDDPTKYRPVALLPAISRVVERVLAKQLKEHVRRARLMPLFQHGFVPGRSCETAMMQLVDMVAAARDRGETVYLASADC